MKTKYCSECDQDKSLKEFASHSWANDGKQSKCKKCRNAINLKRYYALKGNMYGQERI
jgi:hypothetical protein